MEVFMFIVFILGGIIGYMRGEQHKPWDSDHRAEEWHRGVTLFGDPSPWDDDHFR